MNVDALMALHLFVGEPNSSNAARVIHIPILYQILQATHNKSTGYAPIVVGVCQWMYKRGFEVLRNVSKGSTGEVIPLLNREVNDGYDDWEKVGTYYLNG